MVPRHHDRLRISTSVDPFCSSRPRRLLRRRLDAFLLLPQSPHHHTHTHARLWEASRDPPARLLRSRPTLPFVVAQTAASGPRLRLQRAPRVHIFGFVDLLLTVKIGREPTGSQKIRRLPPTSSWTRQKTKKSPDHPEPPARSGGSEPAQFTQKKHPAPRKVHQRGGETHKPTVQLALHRLGPFKQREQSHLTLDRLALLVAPAIRRLLSSCLLVLQS